MSAMPTDNFRFCPPDKFFAITPALSVKSISAMMSLTACPIKLSFMPWNTEVSLERQDVAKFEMVASYERQRQKSFALQNVLHEFWQRIANAQLWSTHQIRHHVEGKCLSFCEFPPSDFDPECHTLKIWKTHCASIWKRASSCIILTHKYWLFQQKGPSSLSACWRESFCLHHYVLGWQ